MRTYTQKQIEEAQKLYETTSKTNQEIGDELGIPKGTIQMWTKKYEWKRNEELQEEFLKNKSKRCEKIVLDDNYYKAKDLYENTLTPISEICKLCNMTKDKLYGRINRDNWYRSKEQVSKSKSEQLKNIIANQSKEQRLEIRQKMSETNKKVWAERSEEKKQEIIRHRMKTINNKSKNELLETNKKISNSVKEAWNNKSEEEKLNIRKKLSYAQQHLPEEAKRLKIQRDRATKHKNNSFRNCRASDGTRLDSKYEVVVYEFCKRNHIPMKTQIPIEYNYNGELHITYIDFEIDGILFECKGGHLLKGIYDYALPVPIERKLEVYKEHNVVLITDDIGGELIPNGNSKYSNGLKYLNKCPNPLIGIDINLFINPVFPYDTTKPKCFYNVRVDNKLSPLEAWNDELLRWKMIKNRIMYYGGYINNKSLLTAMNVTRTYKQPSWFDKNYAKQLIQKYITTNYVLDPFAGWGTRCDACKELNKEYLGGDYNEELVQWHLENNRNIIYQDANRFQTDSSDCSVFICPPYTDKEVYFEGQNIEKTQCQWLATVMKNIPNAKEYLMVCKVVDEGWEQYVVEEKINKSHFGINKEYVIYVSNEMSKILLKYL